MRTLALGAVLAAACQGEIDLGGKTREETVRIVATAMCDWWARCGRSVVECVRSSSGGLACEGYRRAVRYETCVDDTGSALGRGLSARWPLSTELERRLGTCVQRTIERECPTRSELDRAAAAAGPDAPHLTPVPLPPAECDAFDLLTGGFPEKLDP